MSDQSPGPQVTSVVQILVRVLRMVRLLVTEVVETNVNSIRYVKQNLPSKILL